MTRQEGGKKMRIPVVVGKRYSWYRGPSKILVVGLVKAVRPAKEAWCSRIDQEQQSPPMSTQYIYECVEEYTIDALSHPGAKWVVPECDFVKEWL